ncbi:hypothetical protein PI124_g10799 [Phytophthora idaei]|nr:hypothetical protein PI124_g10799 [Phytophthora idaei]
MVTAVYLDHCIALGVAEDKELVDGIPFECIFNLVRGVTFRMDSYVRLELLARAQFKGNEIKTNKI